MPAHGAAGWGARQRKSPSGARVRDTEEGQHSGAGFQTAHATPLSTNDAANPVRAFAGGLTITLANRLPRSRCTSEHKDRHDNT